MSISADSPSDETLNRGPLALLLRRQYEFPFGINAVQFSIFNFTPYCIVGMNVSTEIVPPSDFSIEDWTLSRSYGGFSETIFHPVNFTASISGDYVCKVTTPYKQITRTIRLDAYR